MLKKYYISIFVLFCLLFSSCIEKINNLDINYKQTPIVNCFFTTDSVFTVYVGLTSDLFNELPDSIPEASVKIVSEIGDTLYFRKKDAHIFISDSTAKQDITYKLIVETSNFGILTAQSKIPNQTAKIDTASFYENLYYQPIFNKIFDKITLTIENSNTNNNYYEAVVLSKTEAGTIDDIPFDKLFFSQNYFTDCSAIINFQNINKTTNSLLFNDLHFTEKFQQIFFYCNVYYVPEKTKYLIVNLKQTSEEYYLYRSSINLNNVSEENNFSIDYILNNSFTEQNTEIYSNIAGGVGIFAGYNCSENYIIYQNDFIKHN